MSDLSNLLPYKFLTDRLVNVSDPAIRLKLYKNDGTVQWEILPVPEPGTSSMALVTEAMDILVPGLQQLPNGHSVITVHASGCKTMTVDGVIITAHPIFRLLKRAGFVTLAQTLKAELNLCLGPELFELRFRIHCATRKMVEVPREEGVYCWVPQNILVKFRKKSFKMMVTVGIKRIKLIALDHLVSQFHSLWTEVLAETVERLVAEEFWLIVFEDKQDDHIGFIHPTTVGAFVDQP